MVGGVQNCEHTYHSFRGSMRYLALKQNVIT